MAEVGHFALLSALVLSSCAIVADLVGKWRGSARLIRSGRDATIASFICLSIAVIALIIALAGSDFESAYAVRRTSTPFSAGYESITPSPATAVSMLFWLFGQAGFALIEFVGCREDRRRFNANARIAANLVSVFFLLVVAFKINPFAIFDPVPPGGAVFNPRLLDSALLVGYASCVVPLAWSFAWLKWDNSQQMDSLLGYIHRHILMSWFFLTVGAVGGALLIYRQVGSEGGWLKEVIRDVWLMPWLPATALLCWSRLHKRNAVATKWIVPLSLITFSSCILTTLVGRPDMPAGARRLFIILLIHIWALAAISVWRRYRRSNRSDKTRKMRCDL